MTDRKTDGDVSRPASRSTVAAVHESDIDTRKKSLDCHCTLVSYWIEDNKQAWKFMKKKRRLRINNELCFAKLARYRYSSWHKHDSEWVVVIGRRRVTTQYKVLEMTSPSMRQWRREAGNKKETV